MPPIKACSENQLIIGLELCEAGSLADLCSACGIVLLEDEAAEVAACVLLALRYLHEEARVIHRDVKAANILLTGDGRCKLADFGVSASLEHTLSKRRTVVGSPYWMAPEIIAAESAAGTTFAAVRTWVGRAGALPPPPPPPPPAVRSSHSPAGRVGPWHNAD